MEDIDLVRRIGPSRLVMLRARAVNKTVARPNGLINFALTVLHALRLPNSVLARLG
jgi:hypothetical protein